MQDLSNFGVPTRKDRFSAAPREIADADQPLRLKRPDGLLQVPIAGGKQGVFVVIRQFIRSIIATRVFHKGEGAVVEHQVLLKKALW